MRLLAQKIIIQNKIYAAAFTERYHIPSSKVLYIPHGNYIDAYGPARADNSESQIRSREALGIPVNATVLLALGALRPYKQLEMLIDAVHNAGMQASEEGAVHLVIAGKGIPEYVQKLHTKVNDIPNIQLMSQFVPDTEIPTYFAAADYALFAHGASSLTSGAILLALSYGTPVITLPMHAAEVIKEGANGYVVQDTDALNELLKELPHMTHLDRNAVKETVVEYSWESVGAQVRTVYSSLFLPTKRTIKV